LSAWEAATMDNAARTPAVAGLFGGSGNHTVQIVVLIAVAILLIGYFGFRFVGGGRGGSSRAGAGADARRDIDGGRPSEGSASDGTVRLERRWTSLAAGNALVGGNKPMTIAVDGIAVGEVEPRETVDVAVAPGHHTLQLKQGRHRSPARSFDVAAQETVSFYCHGPRYGWPQLLAALVKPDLWISLKRE
jgi:hypothetical protein